jgi:hypothetical protein
MGRERGGIDVDSDAGEGSAKLGAVPLGFYEEAGQFACGGIEVVRPFEVEGGVTPELGGFIEAQGHAGTP